jgi:hypothetical protein
LVTAGNGGAGNNGGNGDTGGVGGTGGLAGDARGGGLFFDAHAGTSTIVNSTIADNAILGFPGSTGGTGGNGGQGSEAVKGGEGGYGGNGGAMSGGGMFLAGGTLELHNDTIADNSVADSSGGMAGQGYPDQIVSGATLEGNGGGVVVAAGILDAFNTLIARNSALVHPDFKGTFNTAKHDLLGVGDAMLNNISTSQPDDNLVNVGYSQLHLAVLGNYGGPTKTMELTAGSAAINQGENDLAVDANGQPLTTDQRGQPRFYPVPKGPVDIGAVEYQGKADDALAPPNSKHAKAAKSPDGGLLPVTAVDHGANVVGAAVDRVMARAFTDLGAPWENGARVDSMLSPMSPAAAHPDVVEAHTTAETRTDAVRAVADGSSVSPADGARPWQTRYDVAPELDRIESGNLWTAWFDQVSKQCGS